eukprot:TRINITY_DN76216_c0_g1_i1.p1 TRINITY_DN76216_c0_g1~~TRINITY_DN76216_c0_g1_i1.p1  ORF type:complete len:263 (+),score=66.52 TRINITY_DN76216_c0_g1_i1:79-867(+)
MALIPSNYAVDAKQFPADKEVLWKHAAHEDGWTHAHNAIRMELDNFMEALKAVQSRAAMGNLIQWEITAMQKWWDSHEKHTHSHHHNEDDLFNPFLKTRIQYPKKLETDHVGLVAKMNHIKKLIGGLDVNISNCVDLLVTSWGEYSSMMKAHLREEEEVGIPLMRAFFSPEEIGKLVQQILGSPDAPQEEMGSFIFCMGEEAFRNKFMPQEGIPFFVWWVGGFSSKLEYYKSTVASQINGLTTGVPPSQATAGGLWCCAQAA